MSERDREIAELKRDRNEARLAAKILADVLDGYLDDNRPGVIAALAIARRFKAVEP